MRNNLFYRLSRQGLDEQVNPLEYRRILLINHLVIFSVIISVLLIITNFFFSLYFHVAINALMLVVLMAVIFLNRKRKYLPAALLFVNVGCLAVFFASLLAFKTGRFTDTENILFAFLAVSVFLFDVHWKVIQSVFILIGIILIKYLKWMSMGLNFDSDFYLLIVNILVVSTGLYFFLGIFKKALTRALNKSIEHERTVYSLINNVPLFIGLMDSKGKYKVVNKHYERVFNKPKEEMIGVNPKSFFPPDIYSIQHKLYLQAMEGERPEFNEKRDMGDGTFYYARGKFVPITNGQGKINEVAVYVSNVTDLQMAKEKLELANETKSKLFSIVAHDIRSPLSLFEGLVTASQKMIITPEEFVAFQEKIIERFKPLQRTINDLLDWSRVQMSEVGAYPVMFSVLKPIQDIASVYKELADQKQIKLQILGADCSVYMDPNHFKMVIRNLMHNALKFTPVEGQVTVKIDSQGSACQFQISDTGIGMPAEVVEKVRKKVLVNSMLGTQGETGTGLGLNMIAELLEKNGCEFEITSELDKGSIISFKVPTSK